MFTLSEHPVAEAIVQNLKEENTASVQIDKFKSITGMGVQSDFENIVYRVGNDTLMQANAITIPRELEKRTAALKQKVQTVVYFSVAQKVVAIIAVADEILEVTLDNDDEAIVIETVKKGGV